MHTLHDYVTWIAESMGICLSDDQLDVVTNYLLESEKYKAALHELEYVINKVHKHN